LHLHLRLHPYPPPAVGRKARSTSPQFPTR
jgi:hypothetical protein